MNMVQRGGNGGGAVVVGGSGGGVGVEEVSRDSTADLSSPLSEPERPQSFPSPSQQLLNHEAPQYAHSTIQVDHYGGEKYSVTPPATTSTRHTSNLQPPATSAPTTKDEKPKIRRPRKKTAAAVDAEKEKKEKATRKARTPSGTGGTARKKAKVDTSANVTSTSAPLVHDGQSQIQHHVTPLQASPNTINSTSVPTNPADYPIRPYDAATIDALSTTRQQETPRPPSPAPASRLSYDPVRSMMVERNPPPKVYSTAPPPSTSTPSKPVAVRTSTSPVAISHIIDPPSPPPPPLHKPSFQAPATTSRSLDEQDEERAWSKEGVVTQMDVDPPSKPASQAKKVPSGTPSNAPSPKPARAKEQPPPLPQRSGLLSSALFGNATNDAATPSEQAPTIVVHVKLKSNDNNIVNFARLAEEKYGFAALHPRLAAQRERLARVAAAGAALEKSANGSRVGGTSAGESGDDDLSVDIDRESDNDGDVPMTGVDGAGTAANSGTDATGPKKRRRKKVEDYDQDDPFVDDSELAWEAQAAAVKDGFFVYCGPLVPEGEKPAVERADGSIKRGRGRGRGGGPGSRGGRGAAAVAAAAAAAAATAAAGAVATAGNGESGNSRGGGAGSRGGTTTRKPRVTKASRAAMDREKHDREKMAPLAAKPSGYPVAG